jgi:hypothetical protein
MKKIFLGSLLVLLALGLTACGFPIRHTQVRGNGKLVTESRHISGFNSVELSGVGRLIIEQGNDESLEISAEENIMRYLRSDVHSSTLKLGVEEFVSLQPSEEIIYRLSVKDLRRLETSGLGNIEIGNLGSDHLKIEISGSGKISINKLTADRIIVEISGLGDVYITGEVEYQRIRLSGAGNYDASDLQSAEANLEISGTGRAVLWVTDSLDIELSGAGSVRYYGSPQVQSEMSGLGEIKSLGDK